jgi:enoyl-CoA hydratase/carnithine racemase
VAAVEGALGGGFELALGADIGVVSPQARFEFPEAGVGIVPGVGGVRSQFNFN